jgi:DNA-binding response OmpR family regulator
MAPDPPSDSTPKGFVLVIDDEPVIQDLLSQILTRNGFEVTMTGDLESGRQALSLRSFDVVIADLNLPGGGGDALCLEAKSSWPEVRSIVITGDSEPDISKLAEEPHVDAVLCKPFDLSELLSVIEELGSDPQET